ncbi:four helix bundle protein [Desulfoplanes sp.]
MSGRGSEADYLTKCSIDCKEARGTLYWLKLPVASEILAANGLSELIPECNDLVAILTSITERLKEKRNG